MPEFVVKTWETVEGSYTVQAADEAEARAKFDNVGVAHIDWRGVTRDSYMAFEVEVRGVVAMSRLERP